MALSPDKPDPNGPSPLHFIESGLWKEALLTTYALSLTYFESYVLPRLRDAGCEKITLLVDIQGYRGSLMELRARHVGKDYALVPVRVAGGIFHPKITYLRGEEQDLLLIGSGNLTFGGHGQNLEVLEVLSAEQQPGAFGQFADFLQNLRTQPRLQIADDPALLPFIQRAREQSQAFRQQAPEQPVELLHSLDSTISQQLIQRATGLCWQSLLLLSPFHSGDSQFLRKLLETLQIERLTLGVAAQAPSSFPLDETRNWPVKIDWVTPRVKNNQRRLHAKWLELRGSETWTLTGSVNATQTSMDSTRNVEVAVLRKLADATDECWERIDPPPYAADHLSFQDLASSLCVYAHLNHEQCLEGRVIGPAPLAGKWQATLECTEQILLEQTLDLNSAGQFVWPLDQPLDSRLDDGLQIRLLQEGRSARGWVNISAFLSMPLPIRSLCGALGRLLGGNQAQNDLQILLNCLCIHSARLPDEPDAAPGGKAMTAEPATPPAEPRSALPRHWLRTLANASSSGNDSWQLLQAIAGLLHYAPPGQFPGSTPDAMPIIELDDGLQEPPAMPESDPEPILATGLLNTFNQQFQKLINLEGLSSQKKARLLYVWCHVALDVYLRRLHLPGNARDFAQRWLNCVDHAQLNAEDRPLLDEAVHGLAASLALPGTATPPGAPGTLDASTLHEYLERYCRTGVNFPRARELAQRWFQQQTPQLLVAGAVPAALAALDALQQVPTLRELLDSYIDDRQHERRQKLPADRFSPEEISALLHIHSPNQSRPGYHRVNHRSIRHCPNLKRCAAPLAPDVLARLKQRRISRCPGCEALLVSLEP